MTTPTATIFLPWHALDAVHQRGLRAEQPAATAVVPGTLYGVTDEGDLIERSNGTAWEAYSPTGGSGGAPAAHHVTHETGGSDVVTLAQSQVTGLTTALSGKVDTSDPRLTDARTPTAHHVSHEPGGSDALTALDGSVITTGTLPDARLSATVARRDQANTFTAGPQLLTYPNATLQQVHPAAASGSRMWGQVTDGITWQLQALNDAGTVPASTPLLVNRTGILAVGTDLYEKGRAQPMGHWINVPNNAGNFSAIPSGSVTVSAYLNQGYTLIGKTLIYLIYLQLTVGGSPTSLRIALPPGLTAAAYAAIPYLYGSAVGMAQVAPGDGTVGLFRDPSGSTPWVPGAYYTIAILPLPIT